MQEAVCLANITLLELVLNLESVTSVLFILILLINSVNIYYYQSRLDLGFLSTFAFFSLDQKDPN